MGFKAEPLTFGVEFEFLVATIIDPNKDEPEADPNKALRFVPNQDDIDSIGPIENDDSNSQTSSEADEVQEFYNRTLTTRALRRHIVETLQAAGLPAAFNAEVGKSNIRRWEVSGDQSVKIEDDEDTGGWDWIDVEVVSPAFKFTPANLSTVQKVCTSPPQTLQIPPQHHDCSARPLSFLWAFEPQLNSLHPIHRIDSPFVKLIRSHSAFAEKWYKEHGERPSPFQDLVSLLKCGNMDEICDAASYESLQKDTQVNFSYVKTVARGVEVGSTKEAKPTVEFRQCDGTLSGRRAVMWIKTVVGIVEYVRSALPSELYELPTIMCKREMWEKLGDGKDDVREAIFGKVVAESSFTVIDLFRRIGLHESAAFYEDRWFQHVYPARCAPEGYVTIANGTKEGKRILVRDLPTLLTVWEYEGKWEVWEEEYKIVDMKRRLWEVLRRNEELIATLGDSAVRVEMDPDDEFWPKHSTIVIVPTPDNSEVSDGEDERSNDKEEDNSDDGASAGTAQGDKRKVGDDVESSKKKAKAA
ncbi:hypothetical protein EG329_011343 [Mollisiaceae sp. DMI_Dod_QoI]|nr:hypothetical protein EG329_011343 [Helotiales sp. DMI_Dod_QoI]